MLISVFTDAYILTLSPSIVKCLRVAPWDAARLRRWIFQRTLFAMPLSLPRTADPGEKGHPVRRPSVGASARHRASHRLFHYSLVRHPISLSLFVTMLYKVPEASSAITDQISPRPKFFVQMVGCPTNFVFGPTNLLTFHANFCQI